MAKYNIPEQGANKVFSKVLGDMDIVGAIETIMGVNEREENNDMTTSKDLLDIKEQLTEVKTEIAAVKAELEVERKTRFKGKGRLLHDKLLDLLVDGYYQTYVRVIQRNTVNQISMEQQLFDDILEDIVCLKEIRQTEIGYRLPLDAVVSATNKYAKRNHLNAEQIENL